MKKLGFCEKQFLMTAKSCEISALGIKEMYTPS